MNYADSMRHQEVMDTTGKTTYSGWFDVSWANELFCFLTAVEVGSTDSESVAVTIERESGYETDVPVTIISFTAVTADVTEEKHAYSPETDNSAPDVHNKIGMRMRYKFVTSGTWAVTSMTVTVNVQAKRN